MEKELKSCTGVLLRADLTWYDHPKPSAKKCGTAMPFKRTSVQDFHSFSIMFYYIICTRYKKIGDLFCHVIFLDFRTVSRLTCYSGFVDMVLSKLKISDKTFILNPLIQVVAVFLIQNGLLTYFVLQYSFNYFMYAKVV